MDEILTANFMVVQDDLGFLARHAFDGPSESWSPPLPVKQAGRAAASTTRQLLLGPPTGPNSSRNGTKRVSNRHV